MGHLLQGLLLVALLSSVLMRPRGAEELLRPGDVSGAAPTENGEHVCAHMSEVTARRPRFVYVASDGNTLESDLVPKPAGTIRFIVISDTHTRESELSIPDADVLIHAGDVLFRNSDRHQNSSIGEFSAWAEKQAPPIRILIGGNHDKVLEDMGKDMAKDAFSAGQYLQDESLELNGIRLYASPLNIPYWRRPTTNHAFEKQDPAAYTALLAAIPEGIDILVTHTAPQGYLDLIELKSDGWLPIGYEPGHHHVGCPELAERVRAARPRYHVFGHVHRPLPRAVKGRDTIYINACSVCELNPSEGDLLLPIMFDVLPSGATVQQGLQTAT